MRDRDGDRFADARAPGGTRTRNLTRLEGGGPHPVGGGVSGMKSIVTAIHFILRNRNSKDLLREYRLPVCFAGRTARFRFAVPVRHGRQVRGGQDGFHPLTEDAAHRILNRRTIIPISFMISFRRKTA